EKKEPVAAVSFSSGNDTVIQPVRRRESMGLTALLEIALGILVGVLVTYFLIVPAREAAVRTQSNEQQALLGEQMDAKNAEIADMNARIRELEQTITDQRLELDEYTGSNGVLSANDHLQAAASAYLDSSEGALAVEQYLGMIPESYVETASPEFKELMRSCSRQSVTRWRRIIMMPDWKHIGSRIIR
ncbi:MAG: hypothetical protein IKM88_05240, partial [Lachnospiraceae bacterium]|nr:hypothetical protein [Lachnospiraceae bacterium]